MTIIVRRVWTLFALCGWFATTTLDSMTLVVVVAGFSSPVLRRRRQQQQSLLLSWSSSRQLRLYQSFEGTVVVCTGPTCTRNGGGSKLVQHIQELLLLAKDDNNNNNDNNDNNDEGQQQQQQQPVTAKIVIDTVNCVSECAECGLGPNCELRAAGDEGPFYPIINRIRTKADIQKMLSLSAAAGDP